MNYNKLNFYGSIAGLIIGIGVLIGLPLINLGFIPNYYIFYLILGIMAFAIIFMLGMMILLITRKEIVSKLAALVFIPATAAVAFFALITYQMLGPQLVDPAKLPYFDLVNRIDPWNIFGYLPLFATGIFFLFLAPLIIYLLIFRYTTFFTREKILKNGIRAQARILKAQYFGMQMNSQPVYKLTLEINSAEFGSYTLTKNFYVPGVEIANIKPGEMVNVRIDPNNKNKVVLDTWTGNVSD